MDPVFPTDYEYFTDALCADIANTQVIIDMVKAKTIAEDHVRYYRDFKWIDFDKRYFEAERDGDDLTSLNAERQTLKDEPQVAQPLIDAATNTAELKTVMGI